MSETRRKKIFFKVYCISSAAIWHDNHVSPCFKKQKSNVASYNG